ncbi:hypothetical protein [Halobacillus sp. Marseille-Q1614]|uniref:hypothetical protein n=1 Tax=Halobacillus sp. Marseille-Q1614 TaxID=2709134 RepID=UPI0015703263|nr:hypothetical protein [Halobacillus sp. Marseille-Q1614]
MIVQITGNVKFPITLDPTVWIFDDRKLTFNEIFNPSSENQAEEEENELKRQSLRFDREVYQQKINPPVNKSINRYEKERILKETFLMPIQPFIQTSEPSKDVKEVTLVSKDEEHTLDADRFSDALLLFSKNGKPLSENGPVHVYFEDQGEKQTPIEGVTKIVFS